MLKTLGTEFKVGLFAVVAVATLVYMFFVLNPESFKSRDYVTYYTVLKNAAGIVTKTHVKTSGVSIGKVKQVSLDGATTKVLIDLDKTVKIPVGSRIEIRSVGLLGDKHLEVVRPEDLGQYIEGNGFIPQSDDSVDMEALIGLVGDIAKDVKKVTNSLANVLGTKKGEQSMANIVDNIEKFTKDLKETTETLKKVVGDREEDLQDIVTNVRDGVRDVRAFAANLRDVLDDENRAKIDRILASFDETMVDVKGSARNINLIAQKVEKGEGTLGKLVNDDTTITEIEGAIRDIRKVIAPATKLQIEVDGHVEVRKDQNSQTYFNLLFRTRPDRFYLVGISDTHYRNRETTTETQTATDNDKDGLPDVTVKEKIRDEQALRINLQMGKRWYYATLRAGLFETTGGVAGDLHFFNDRLKLTLEAFDFNSQDKTIRRTAHVKTYASALFYNHVYAMIGIDDPSRTDPKTNKADKDINFFVGGGLTFNDQDLKALFGAAALASAAK